MSGLTIAHRPAGFSRPVRVAAVAFEKVAAVLRVWRRRQRERASFLALSDVELQDLGISRAQANFDSNRPFWRG